MTSPSALVPQTKASTFSPPPPPPRPPARRRRRGRSRRCCPPTDRSPPSPRREAPQGIHHLPPAQRCSWSAPLLRTATNHRGRQIRFILDFLLPKHGLFVPSLSSRATSARYVTRCSPCTTDLPNTWRLGTYVHFNYLYRSKFSHWFDGT